MPKPRRWCIRIASRMGMVALALSVTLRCSMENTVSIWLCATNSFIRLRQIKLVVLLAFALRKPLDDRIVFGGFVVYLRRNVIQTTALWDGGSVFLTLLKLRATVLWPCFGVVNHHPLCCTTGTSLRVRAASMSSNAVRMS